MSNNDDRKLGDAFQKGGIFAENIRISIDNDDDAELRESLKAHGWIEEFPALIDEHDVTLVGHRRLKIAKELGITPVIKKLMIGSGDEADAKRLRLAIASNIGFKPMTKADRQRISEYLYGEREWTMQRIADALNVSTRQISRDLDSFDTVSKPQRPKGGRPKGSGKLKDHYRAEEVIAQHDSGMTHAQIAVTTEIGQRQVRHIIEREKALREGEQRASGRIDPSTLSVSAREKLQRAVAQEKKHLAKEFYAVVEQRVREQVKLNLESVRDRLEQQRKLSEDIIKRRNGFIIKRVWNLIRACLHPDKFDQIVSLVSDGKTEELSKLKAQFSDAFRMFKQFEKFVLNEKESPTSFAPPLPKTPADWAAAKAAAIAARKAARQARKVSGSAVAKR